MKYVYFFLLASWFCSCKVIERKIYSSTVINNPALEKKNDHSFSLTYSLPSGFDLSGGYAVAKNFALIGGVYSHKNHDNEEKSSIFSSDTSTAKLLYRHKGYHLGAGVFFPLSKTDHVSFASFYGGYIQGSFRMNERFFNNSGAVGTPARVSFFNSDIGRYFLQGSISAYTKLYKISFTSRYNYVGYFNVVTDYSPDLQQSFKLPPSGYPRYSQFLDFAVDGKFFFSEDNPQVGIQVIAAFTARLNRKDSNFDYYPLRLGIGLVIKNPFQASSRN